MLAVEYPGRRIILSDCSSYAMYKEDDARVLVF